MESTKLYRFIPWIIVFLAFVATSLSFLDRQVLSISIIRIKEDFPISDVEYGFINTGFLIGYAIMFTVGGILIDRYGSRWGLAISVGFWSLATSLHSFAQNALHFGIYRFMLGLGEGGAFPGAVRAVVEWVPKKWQALANGIAIGGAAIGAVVAPLLCIWLIKIIGWRGLFMVSSAIGLVWVVLWLLASKRKFNKKAETEIETTPGVKIDPKRPNFSQLLRIKETRIFILMRFLLDPVLYFYMFWIPKYLHEYRGSNIEQVGKLFWIPFLALGISNMLGGWISDRLYIKGSSLDYARKTIMGLAALMMLPVLGVKFMPSSEWVIVIITVAFFAHGLWITNYVTSISDTFGKSSTSTVIGMSGTAGALSSLALNPVIGYIITKFSYDPMWLYAGSMYLVAFIAFVTFIPKLRLLKAFA